MKTKSLLSLSLMSCLTFVSGLTLNQKPVLSQSPSQPQFLCANIDEVDSGKKMPATVVWIPEERKNVAMIVWKSEFFEEWSPKSRCDTVSPKFDQAFRAGRLNYLTTGIVKNSPVLCAVQKSGQSCDSENQLFTLKPHQNPSLVLDEIKGFFKGNSGVIYQSGGVKYVEINLEVLKQLPAVEIAK